VTRRLSASGKISVNGISLVNQRLPDTDGDNVRRVTLGRITITASEELRPLNQYSILACSGGDSVDI
jgi:hypothetical protein